MVANSPDVGNAHALCAVLGRGQRLLGIDPGTKRIGIALSDAALLIASPAAVLPRPRLAAALAPLVAKESVGGLVIGLPLSMDGSFGPAAQAARDFGRDLARQLALPWAMMDERLSTAAAQRALTVEADLSRARRAQLVDAMAAAWMLQAFLDSTRGG